MKQNKIKNLLLAVFALLLGVPAFAQVGIGTNNPQGILDVNDSLRDIVLPRVASVDSVKALDGGEAVPGTMVFDMSQNCARVKNISIRQGTKNKGWSDCLLDVAGTKIITDSILQLGTNFTVAKAAVSNNWAVLMGGDSLVWFSGSNANSVGGLGRAGGAVRSYTLVFSEQMRGIVAGTDHVIAVDRSGRVWTWGLNTNSRTGQINPLTSTYVTGGVTGLLDSCDFFGPNSTGKYIAKYVAASSATSFVVIANGDLYSIGTSPADGNGATSANATWTKVSGISNVTQIDASLNNTVGAVTASGDAYVWGTGGGNGLGISTSNLLAPTRLPVNVLIRKIAMGYQCGAAISQDSTKLYVWGANNTVSSPVAAAPIEISARIPNFDASKGDRILDVGMARSGGGNLVIVTNLKKRYPGVARVYVFGRNNYGQLGVGNTTNQYATGGGTSNPPPTGGGGIIPRAINTMRIDKGTQFTGVACGGYNTILLTGPNSTNLSLSYVAYGAGRVSTSAAVLGAITTAALYFTPLTK